MTAAMVGKISPGSPADLAGIRAKDRLIWLEGRCGGDIIDYRIWEADERLNLLVQSGKGPWRRMRIKKDLREPLGVQFDPPTVEPVIDCRNHCLFCFVDQNPPGMRGSLLQKDDDYRLSFLYGNYITLNHLETADLERIVRLQLSPLYVSVHSTDPALRRRLFRSSRATRGLAHLKYLVNKGIRIHAQIVLCPGYNLGADLIKTVEDLFNLGRALLSVAVVPVGLTSFGRPPQVLRRLTAGEARRVVEEIEGRQRKYLGERGSRFVFLSDELYKLAGRPYPPAAEYEGYPQLENGVGLARLFLEELKGLEEHLPSSLDSRKKITLVTGVEAAGLLEKLVDLLAPIRGLKTELLVVENHFFGPAATVAGLLIGEDLGRGLQGISPGEAVFFPAAMLKEGESLFLDGSTPGQLERALQVPLIPVEGPLHFVRELDRRFSRVTAKKSGRGSRGGS